MKFICLYLLIFAVVPVNTQNWGSFRKDDCTYDCKRQYSSILWNIPWGQSWDTACKNTAATIEGNNFRGASRCVNSWNEWGQFDVPDSSCCPRWGYFKQDGCTYNCKRQYSAILWDVPRLQSWDDACKNTPANINGNAFSGAHRCPKTTNQWGEIDVPDSSCCPHWGSFKLDSCSKTPGRAIYSAVLWNIPPKESWESSCNSFGATIGGQQFDKPTECVKTVINMWGKFDATYDQSLAPSSQTCYGFQVDDSCTTDILHDELRRRKKRAKKCDRPTVPISYWGVLFIARTIEELLRQNGQTLPRILPPMPDPPSIQTYPDLIGQDIPNAFGFNGHHAFRLLRSDAEEDRNQRDNPGYLRRQPEGNGLNGLTPLGPYASYTPYRHVTESSLFTQYISSTVDFGRTRDLAVQQALRAYNDEAPRNGGVGFSRWFVQIDMRNLHYYDFTDSNVLNTAVRTRNNYLDAQVVRYARSWSEILITGDVPSDNIMYAFEVHAVNTTHYVIHGTSNPNYHP